ncbi:MAG: class I SAM-dependent methyltransferase [Candidatus Aminicenantia bacterium]
MKIDLIHKLKNKFIHIIFSNKFYKAFLKPFDKNLYEIIPAKELIKERKSSIPLNKICQVADIENSLWRDTLTELKYDMNERNFHRKIWEYVQIIFSLKQLKLLTPESICLAVGAGRELLLYYLTYKIKEIYGIDLYKGKFFGGKNETDIPVSAEKYAPFPYIKEKLNLFRINALKLKFPDNFFDFIFSTSSIEHFGTKNNILQSLKEMYRVLKPGGAAVITTELKLNSLGTSLPNVKPFFFKELIEMIKKAGFKISNDFDLRIEKEYFENWIKLPAEINKRPHVILRFLNTIFTSINVVLLKEGDEALKGEETYSAIPEFIYRGDIKVIPEKNTFHMKEKINLEIILKNNSNFKWINTGESHRISLGIKLYNLNNELINRDFETILLPSEVNPGEVIKFAFSINAPPKKGEWILKFDLKKEWVFWFSEKGNPKTDLKIKVL